MGLVSDVRAKNYPITGAIIQNKATDFVNKISVSDVNKML
jgi:hypothetical protein